MILIYICGTIILIGLIMAIVGKIFKLKKNKNNWNFNNDIFNNRICNILERKL